MGCSSSSDAKLRRQSGIRVDEDDEDAAVQATKFKVVLVGNSAVGKSSIVLRFTQNKFKEAQGPTIGAAFSAKKMHVRGKEITLRVWDTAGEEKFRAMTRGFYRNSDACCLVVDITDAKSFEDAATWLHDFREACPDALVIMAGNKADLVSSRQLSQARARAWCESHDVIGYFEVSALTGAGVEEAFGALASSLVRKRR